MYTFDDLVGIIAKLRSPEGCPWDREQTFESLKKCLADETEEVFQAIDNKDMENLCEELGDVLLQVILNSQIAKEEGRFTIDDVIDGLCRKMVRMIKYTMTLKCNDSGAFPGQYLGGKIDEQDRINCSSC